MSRVRVKICGITRPEDAEAAVRAGADAVGFVLWPASPRAIGVDAAAAIGRALPPFVTRVGVFVDAPPGEVLAAVRAAGLDVAQLHGDERVEDYVSLGVKLLRSTALADDADVDAAAAWPAGVLPLVDARDPVRRGGTGRHANWPRARALAARRRIVLAGGLDAETVRAAVREVQPWAIDVSSGVELSPGIKSGARIEALFDALDARRREAR
jgi:phosphoribosylanthranilate isomerase